jgi:hypothetical protein
MTVSLMGIAALRSQADDLLRAADDAALHAATAGKPFAAPLEEAARISNEVFDSLRPHARQFASFAPEDLGRLVPEATRSAGVSRLDEAIRLQTEAAQGIDDALGAGTWMSKAVRETRGFHMEARRVMADPTLGPDSADHAIDLLRQNGFAFDEAARALRAGNVDQMTNPQMLSVIDDADQAAFDAAASWRTVYGPPPVA